MPAWVAIRVERVQLATNTEWDGPVPESGFASLCKDVGTLVGITGPGNAGAVRLGCALLSDEQQRQADPRDPDLQLTIDVAGVSYRSYVAADRRSHLFAYTFVVPGDAVPTDGVVLSVVDSDTDTKRGQEIGSVRFSRAEMIEMATSGALVTRQASDVSLLEFSVRPFDGRLRKVEVDLDARRGGAEVRGIEVNAGDVVRVEASGSWQIGSWNDDMLGPLGYTDGRLRSSNLTLFADDDHGTAVAVVGQQEAAVLLRPRPCVRVVSPYSGVIWIGINDQEFQDNKGSAHYRIFARPAKRREWLVPGQLLGCDT